LILLIAYLVCRNGILFNKILLFSTIYSAFSYPSMTQGLLSTDTCTIPLANQFHTAPTFVTVFQRLSRLQWYFQMFPWYVTRLMISISIHLILHYLAFRHFLSITIGFPSWSVSLSPNHTLSFY
jgi:hypothetical protein